MRKFAILGGEVCFLQPQLEYISLRKTFADLNDKIRDDAENQLGSCVSDIEGLPSVLTALVSGCLQETSDLGVECLCERGIYDVDENGFQQQLVSTVEKGNFLEPIVSLGTTALEIEDIRGTSGIGLMGGGFGIEGAARGIAVAGAVNLLTSALSGVAASAQRQAQRQATAAALKQTGQLPTILDALEKIVDGALGQTAQYIAERNPGSLEFPSPAEVERSKALVSNLAKGRVSPERTKGVLLEALQQNPYDPAVHVVIASQHPDVGEANALANFLDIDVREHAGKGSVKELLGPAAVDLSYWTDDLLSVVRRFPNKHLHVEPHIPDRKISGARREYFREGIGYPDGMVSFRLVDIGLPLALIDTSLFGGGGTGIVFSSTGFTWRDIAEEPLGLQWIALKHLEDNIQKTLFGVRIFGGEIQLSGVDISKRMFIDLLFAIRDQLERRKWKT